MRFVHEILPGKEFDYSRVNSVCFLIISAVPTSDSMLNAKILGGK